MDETILRFQIGISAESESCAKRLTALQSADKVYCFRILKSYDTLFIDYVQKERATISEVYAALLVRLAEKI